MRQARQRFGERASLYWRLAGGTARAALWMLMRRGRDPRVEGQFDAFISYSQLAKAEQELREGQEGEG